MPPGKYVCFEGPHGSGKSSLVAAVAAELGRRATTFASVRFPSGGPIGQMIRSYLSGERMMENPKALLYLYAADGHDLDPWMRKVIEDSHLLSDRHPIHSGRVYQLEHHPEWHVLRVYDTTELLVPDVLFVVDVPPEVTISRLRMRDKYKAKVFETEDVDRITTFRNRYTYLARTAVSFNLARECYMLDGTRPLQVLVDEVIRKAGL